MPKGKNAHKKDNKTQGTQAPDPVILGKSLLDAYEKAQPLMQKYLEKYGNAGALEGITSTNFDPLNMRESYLNFLDNIAQDPTKIFEMQSQYMQDCAELWQESLKRFLGEPSKTVIEPDKGDRRFNAPEWQESALFDFIKQSYLITCRHIERSVEDMVDLNKEQKDKLSFQSKLFTSAISPTNFALTNPEVLNETIKTGGQNLVKGFENLINDLNRGQGDLKISTTNYDAFKVGKNLATTKGSVVYQNDLMQLIQYEGKTNKVNQTPLLIVPPWINKYYILDLAEKKSFTNWAVEQGHTVFIISWVNPSEKLAQKSFDDYMQEGILSALEQIKKNTHEEEANVVGYCLGGTLLASTLAYLAANGDHTSIKSATFLTTLLDFDKAGDMKLFLDDEQLEHLERLMDQHGVLDGKELQRTFSLMRSNDLIWSFVVNNYLMGKEPFPFDLLYWNDDCTNMPSAMHRFYLRKMYKENLLPIAGGIKLNDTPIDLSLVKTPCHFISTKEDHIAPWVATYQGVNLLKGDNTFTLAGSGHIAGVVNPPSKNKYSYWTNSQTPNSPEKWLENTTEHKGSWWPYWNKWIGKHTGKKDQSKRKIGNEIEPAPGSYVKICNN